MLIKRGLRMIPAVLLALCLCSQNLPAQGHFEFSFHYATWSIDILGNLIENAISDALETDLKDAIVEDIQAEHPGLQEQLYTQEVSFDSGGHNYGFELRWYPGGQNGSFSLGFSVEKTSMEVSLPEISTALELTNNASFQGAASGSFLIEPLSFHLSLRWDILPSSRVHPYITFGVGAASFSSIEDDELSYSYAGELSVPGQPKETFQGGETKTIGDLQDDLEKEDEEFLPISFLPFIQLNLGLKGKITENIHLLIDAGVWNGLLLRGGVAIRL